MGDVESDIPTAVSALASQPAAVASDLSPMGEARILDTLQMQRFEGCYTGLDNTS